MIRGLHRRLLLWRALVLVPALAISGCALFTKPPSELVSKAFKLPTIGIPPDAIQLEVVYVERPLGDARLGVELWRSVDEISCVEPEQRAMLKRNGFRAGVVGSNPPPALQQMLGLKHDFVYEPKAEKSKQLVGHRYVLRSGGQQTMLASPVYPECSMDIPQGEQIEHHSFENAQCKYRVTARRLQEGWIELDFVPQIDYGAEQMRRVVGEDGWQFQNGQKNVLLFQQRFTVQLAVGDMAILTSADDASGRLGELFFRGPPALARPVGEAEGEPSTSADSLASVQRLLIVRLAGMGNGDAASSTTSKPATTPSR